MKPKNIFIVGLMAVGKSTVGRMLAEACHMEFFDSDHEIEARTGAEISWIFDVEGEQGFRDREEQVIDDLTRAEGIVLATGGGAIKRDINRKRLAERGTVIHLDCPLDKLLARTSNDKRRPLLQGPDREEVLRKLFAERAPLYQEVADYRFVSSDSSPRNIVNSIRRKLKREGVLPA